MRQQKLLLFPLIFTSTLSTLCAALPVNPWYVSLNSGIFQGNFDLEYNDLSDVIAQDIRQPVQQNGYSGGIGIGYNTIYRGQYLLGGELSGNFFTYNANFASGASSSAFTDQITIRRNADLVFIPGIFTNESMAIYAKAGISYANINSALNSPTGFTPTYASSNSTVDTLGIALGLGAKKWVTDHVAVMAEYLYHDYGKINFANFQNFTATYSHAARVNTQNIVIGIHYFI